MGQALARGKQRRVAEIRAAARTNGEITRGRPRSHRIPVAENLTVGSLYDIALHGASLGAAQLHGVNGGRLPALTGAAMDVQKQNAQDVRRLIQPWQARAMSYYDLVPEVKFAATFMSQLMRKVRLFPAMIDPKTHEAEELDSGPIFDAFGRIKDRNGGMADLQGSIGKLRFLIGEGYLTVSPDIDRGEVWEYLSPNELRVQPGGIASRFRAPMLSADQYIIGNDQATAEKYGGIVGPEFTETGPDVIVVYRLWRPSPAYSDLADCNMQATVDLLEELVLSTYSVRAQLKSRLNNGGILWVPDEISFTSLGNDPEEDPTSDEFQARLTEAIMAAISDPGSAAAFSPIVARVASEFIGKIQHTKFNDNPGELAEISQRSEMVERFGVGVELPPDLFKSTEDSNHWNQWLVDEQTWKSYGQPAALELASDINAAYLQPEARELGEDWENVTIGVDPSEAINHPDRAKDADALYQGRAISKKVWRESKGYNDNDAMPEDELNEMLGVQIRDGSLAKYGIPSVRANIEPAPGDIESTTGEVDATATTPVSGADTERGAPQTGPPSEPDQGGPALQASAASRENQILGAAEMAVQRAREMAGAKLRATAQRSKSCPDCLDAITAVPNWDVAATLGNEQVARLANGGHAALVDGAGLAFAAVLERMAVSRSWATELGELVEQHAARTLYQVSPDPLPAAFALLLRRIDTPLEPSA